MAIIWAESFDYYGTGATGNGGRDYMLAGLWANFTAGNGTLPFISAAQQRTGTYSLRFEYNSLATDSPVARRVLGSAQLVVGCAQGIYFESLPIANKAWGVEFRNNANQCIAYLAIESDGAIGLYTGSTRVLTANSDPIITASAWQHLEVKAVIDEVVGEVEVRVNGAVVLHATDLNLGALGATQIAFGMPAGEIGDNLNMHFDDIVTWDDTGSQNNDFLGPVRVETLWANADTAQADFTPTGAANGFDCIDNTPPDADTTYLVSTAAGEISEFALSNTPPETANIKGVFIPTMAKLGDAGVGNLVTSLVSGVDASDGPDQVLTSQYTYWGSVHELDPATDLAWTKSGIDAALLRLEKTV